MFKLMFEVAFEFLFDFIFETCVKYIKRFFDFIKRALFALVCLILTPIIGHASSSDSSLSSISVSSDDSDSDEFIPSPGVTQPVNTMALGWEYATRVTDICNKIEDYSSDSSLRISTNLLKKRLIAGKLFISKSRSELDATFCTLALLERDFCEGENPSLSVPTKLIEVALAYQKATIDCDDVPLEVFAFYQDGSIENDTDYFVSRLTKLSILPTKNTLTAFAALMDKSTQVPLRKGHINSYVNSFYIQDKQTRLKKQNEILNSYAFGSKFNNAAEEENQAINLNTTAIQRNPTQA